MVDQPLQHTPQNPYNLNRESCHLIPSSQSRPTSDRAFSILQALSYKKKRYPEGQDTKKFAVRKIKDRLTVNGALATRRGGFTRSNVYLKKGFDNCHHAAGFLPQLCPLICKLANSPYKPYEPSNLKGSIRARFRCCKSAHNPFT